MKKFLLTLGFLSILACSAAHGNGKLQSKPFDPDGIPYCCG
jgi:hypothetical protein